MAMAMLATELTMTAGWKRSSIRVSPSLPGVSTSMTRNVIENTKMPEQAVGRGVDQPDHEVVRGAADGDHHDDGEGEDGARQEDGAVEVALDPDLLAELAGDQDVDDDAADDEHDQADAAVGGRQADQVHQLPQALAAHRSSTSAGPCPRRKRTA